MCELCPPPPCEVDLDEAAAAAAAAAPTEDGEGRREAMLRPTALVSQPSSKPSEIWKKIPEIFESTLFSSNPSYLCTLVRSCLSDCIKGNLEVFCSRKKFRTLLERL